MKKNLLTVLAASCLVAGCISTDLGPAAATAPAEGVNAERTTGSNLSRRDQDARQSMDRQELERLQRSGGSNQIGKSGKI